MLRVLITPAVATQLLTTNIYAHRYPFEAARAEYFAEKMRRGLWREDPPIKIVNGQLRNGRHRLTAVTLTGLSAWFFVKRS